MQAGERLYTICLGLVVSGPDIAWDYVPGNEVFPVSDVYEANNTFSSEKTTYVVLLPESSTHTVLYFGITITERIIHYTCNVS